MFSIVMKYKYNFNIMQKKQYTFIHSGTLKVAFLH